MHYCSVCLAMFNNTSNTLGRLCKVGPRYIGFSGLCLYSQCTAGLITVAFIIATLEYVKNDLIGIIYLQHFYNNLINIYLNVCPCSDCFYHGVNSAISVGKVECDEPFQG